MLRLTPHDRIGCMAAGADDIRKHVWYKGVDFNYLIEKKFKAPWACILLSMLFGCFFYCYSFFIFLL